MIFAEVLSSTNLRVVFDGNFVTTYKKQIQTIVYKHYLKNLEYYIIANIQITCIETYKPLLPIPVLLQQKDHRDLVTKTSQAKRLQGQVKVVEQAAV